MAGEEAVTTANGGESSRENRNRLRSGKVWALAIGEVGTREGRKMSGE